MIIHVHPLGFLCHKVRSIRDNQDICAKLLMFPDFSYWVEYVIYSSLSQVHHTFATAGSDGAFNFWDKDSKQRLKVSLVFYLNSFIF